MPESLRPSVTGGRAHAAVAGVDAGLLDVRSMIPPMYTSVPSQMASTSISMASSRKPVDWHRCSGESWVAQVM